MDLNQFVPAKNQKLKDALDSSVSVTINNPFTNKPLEDKNGVKLSVDVLYAFSESGRNAMIEARRDEEEKVEPQRIVAYSIVGINGVFQFGKKKVVNAENKELLEEMLNELPFVFEQISIKMTEASNFLPQEMLN